MIATADQFTDTTDSPRAAVATETATALTVAAIHTEDTTLVIDAATIHATPHATPLVADTAPHMGTATVALE